MRRCVKHRRLFGEEESDMLFLVLSGIQMLLAFIFLAVDKDPTMPMLLAIWMLLLGILVEVHRLREDA